MSTENSKPPTGVGQKGLYGSPGFGQRLIYGWVRRPGWDALSVAPVAVWVAVAAWRGWPLVIAEVDPQIRRALYQAMLSLAATLVGLNLASVAFLVNMMQTPLKTLDNLLTDDQKFKVGSAFLALLPSLGALFVVSFVGLLVDSLLQRGYWIVGGLAITCLVAASSALLRVRWIIWRLLQITRVGTA